MTRPGSASMSGMDAKVSTDQQEPLTFDNAPTYVENGVTYVDSAAALELSALVAKRYESLLARLATE